MSIAVSRDNSSEWLHEQALQQALPRPCRGHAAAAACPTAVPGSTATGVGTGSAASSIRKFVISLPGVGAAVFGNRDRDADSRFNRGVADHKSYRRYASYPFSSRERPAHSASALRRGPVKRHLVEWATDSAPDANEIVWKETLRMNPGEVTTVIMKFNLPVLPTSAMTNVKSPRTGMSLSSIATFWSMKNTI